ncbi:MAG: TrkH family potassium uptake protein [candidate division WOR-3 bacterium]|nr:TrkH family potassium uptake protein [candidate division WOR-3 bacterium]
MFKKKEINPGRLIILGYVAIALAGTILLSLPFSTTSGISIIDALFTSTSALCVTGLTVKNTATDFTFWGKFIILLLIQIGGLGYMTLSTAFFFFLGKKISLRDRMLFKESINVLSYENLMRFAWRVLRITLIVELIGALLFYLCFIQRFNPVMAAGHAIFHSISAFCNAGFSTFSENLSLFHNSWVVPLAGALLIITGGIGFLVVSDIYYVIIKKEKKDFTLHTKIVLKTTLILLIIGTAFIFLYEGNKSLVQYPLHLKLIHSFFHAVTPRTAGFNTVNIAMFSPVTLLLILLFMFIGASPGGTGGGVKTTTFALITVWVKELLLGRYKNGISLMKKRIPAEQAMRSFLLIFLSIFFILITIFLILMFSPAHPFKLIFEVFSAFGTVGLSLGSAMNPSCSYACELSTVGKLLIIILMLVGRIGTLTIGSAIVRPHEVDYSYPEEHIAIG